MYLSVCPTFILYKRFSALGKLTILHGTRIPSSTKSYYCDVKISTLYRQYRTRLHRLENENHTHAGTVPLYPLGNREAPLRTTLNSSCADQTEWHGTFLPPEILDSNMNMFILSKESCHFKKNLSYLVLETEDILPVIVDVCSFSPISHWRATGYIWYQFL